MPHSFVLAALLCSLPLGACSAPAGQAVSADPARAQEADAAPSLEGRWQLLEVNGAPPRTPRGRPASDLQLVFTDDSYGGNAGCNSFGGLGMQVGDRWFAGGPLSTLVGCGEINDQERAVSGVLSGGPTVAFGADGTATLRAAGRGSLKLRRLGPAPENAPAEPPLLAGTRLSFGALDGKAVDLPGAKALPSLAFEADRWTLDTPCLTASGRWRQQGNAAVIERGTETARACAPALAAPSRAFREALTGEQRFVVGPNREIVIAGGGHWAFGGIERQDGAAGDVAGIWRVEAIDGVAPPPAERAPELTLGNGLYGLWDGCQHSKGVAIVHERQLFTRGSGVVTLANCPDDPVRRRINAVVVGRPRMAWADGGVLALVSHEGSLRLRRTSRRAWPAKADTRLRAGQAFELALAPGLPARLTLGPGDRFTLAMDCGAMTGRWRAARTGDGWAARFGPDRPAPSCRDLPAGSRAHRLFSGDVRAAVGPNGDIALFVNDGEAAPARVVQP